MKGHLLLLCAILVCAAVGGCRHAPSARSDERRETCLAEPDGESPLDASIRHAQEQARKLPIKVDTWVLVGRGWVRKARVTSDPGFYVNVRACVDAALGVSPGNVAALQLRGLALLNENQFREARLLADEILRREPRDTVALGLLSDALLELGEFDRAADAAQQMVDQRPDMSSYSRAARFRWLEGDTASATLFLLYALKGRDARDSEAAARTFVQAGTMYWQGGDYEGAEAVFDEALRWVPDYPAALIGRARVALARRQPARAVTDLDRAYAAAPLAETAWLLGDAHAMLGDETAASQAYDQVVRTGRTGDRLTLALFYATKNREPDEALRLVEAERRVRAGIYVEDTYAWALYRSGRLQEAREASDRALRWRTPDARLLYHAGAIRLASGDGQGRDLIREALHLNPRFDWTAADEASRILHDAKPSQAP